MPLPRHKRNLRRDVRGVRPHLGHEDKVPTAGEVEALRALLARRAERCSGTSPRATPRRNRVLVELLLCTGLRASEAAALLVRDVVIGDDPHLRVVGGKKRGPNVVETVRLPFGMLPALRAYVDGLAPDAPLFCTEAGRPLTRWRLYQVVKGAWLAAGARRVINAHSCRHWFISAMASHPKASPFEVASAARMRDLSTVLVYFHSKGGRELADALSPAAPAPKRRHR